VKLTKEIEESYAFLYNKKPGAAAPGQTEDKV